MDGTEGMQEWATAEGSWERMPHIPLSEMWGIDDGVG